MNLLDWRFAAVAMLAVVARWALAGRVPSVTVPLVASLGFIGLALPLPALLVLGLFVGFGYLLLLGRDLLPLMLSIGLVLALFILAKAGVGQAVPLVLGLSYVMFRLVHLLVDVREGAIASVPRPADYLAYLLFFPAFLAGPIHRFEKFAADLAAPTPLDRAALHDGVTRILTGLAAGIVMAGMAQRGLDIGLATGGPLGIAFAILSFTVLLWFSFSGYSSIAIGLARLLGMTLPENFDRPFQAPNLLEFWSRWHISLSEWFKFYLFNPVLKALLQRDPDPVRAPYFAVACFFLTFFTMGIWHGFGWPYLAYGLLLGLGVSLNKLWQVRMVARMGRKPYQALCKRLPYRIAARTLALSFFVLALVLIWAPGRDIGADALDWLLAAGVVIVALGVAVVVDEIAPKPSPPLPGWIACISIVALAVWPLIADRPPPVLIYQFF